MNDAPIRPLCRVDVSEVAAWITSIPFDRWPQQHPVDAQLRPAMVNDPNWEDFGKRTDALVEAIRPFLLAGTETYNRMLSVVMPGHWIERHRDEQPPDWITRVHVPLVTPAQFSVFVVATGIDNHIRGELGYYELEVGTAYLVDTRAEHSVRNDGTTPRIHFMFDVRSLVTCGACLSRG